MADIQGQTGKKIISDVSGVLPTQEIASRARTLPARLKQAYCDGEPVDGAAGETGPKLPKKRTSDPVKYARLVAQGVRKREAMIQAGYSPKSCTSTIDKISIVKSLTRSIEQQREHLQTLAGYTLTDSANFNHTIRASKQEDTGNRLKADKALRDVLGYNAPTKQVVESRSLIIEMSEMSISQIRQLLGGDQND